MTVFSHPPSLPHPHHHPPKVDFRVHIKFHITCCFSTKEKNICAENPRSKVRHGLLNTDRLCAFLYVEEIKYRDNYAEGAEAEEAGVSAEHASVQEPENFTELRAKETSGPEGRNECYLLMEEAVTTQGFFFPDFVFVLSHCLQGGRETFREASILKISPLRDSFPGNIIFGFINPWLPTAIILESIMVDI